jgi:hypothetical protein
MTSVLKYKNPGVLRVISENLVHGSITDEIKSSLYDTFFSLKNLEKPVVERQLSTS